MSKLSIRFFNDREVRAVWDDGAGKWFFSVLDVVGALNGQGDHAKNRNYWKWLKAKLKREGNQLVSATTQLKLTAPDGKQLMKRGCSGTILSAILPGELVHVPLPLVDPKIQKELAKKVQSSFALRAESKRLLDLAKRAVEVAIEEGEEKAQKGIFP